MILALELLEPHFVLKLLHISFLLILLGLKKANLSLKLLRDLSGLERSTDHVTRLAKFVDAAFESIIIAHFW